MFTMVVGLNLLFFYVLFVEHVKASLNSFLEHAKLFVLLQNIRT